MKKKWKVNQAEMKEKTLPYEAVTMLYFKAGLKVG